jgi:aminoglycoside phosphotransferase (APT) family kinase protein
MGEPTEYYPWHWSVYQWIDGQTASIERIADLSTFAIALANFLIALQKIDTTGGPLATQQNFYRGGPLANYDEEARQAIALLTGKIDTDMITKMWNEALASTWQNTPVWVHGDVAPTNLLVKNGKLSAVIDFGSMAIGDPACDVVIAWTLFKGESRELFRNALELDNDTWARARGWALWKALIICAELPGTNPLEKEKSWKVIDELLYD